MTQEDTIALALSLSMLLATGLIFGALARRFHLPLVLGELIGGVVLGPTLIRRFIPLPFAKLYPTTGAVAIGRDAFIQLGLLFFLFTAGQQMNLPALRRLGRSVLWTSGLGIAIPFGLGFLMVLAAPERWAAHIELPTSGAALLIGTALSISALPVIARVLFDLGLARREFGALVLSSATLDDLVGWSLFAAILGSFTPHTASRFPPWASILSILGFAALVLTLGRFIVRQVRARIPAQRVGARIGIATLLCLLAAAAAEWMGVHAIVGAFLVGLALTHEPHASTEPVHQFALGIFAPIYFVSLGLRTDFASNFDLGLVALVLVIACLGKIIGATLGALLGGIAWRPSLAVGFGMNARGAMEIILASVALEQHLIDERLFVALVVMALVTSLLSGSVMARLLADHPQLERTSPQVEATRPS
jgi:Kef-type K+ transport system membrane component KefB